MSSDTLYTVFSCSYSSFSRASLLENIAALVDGETLAVEIVDWDAQ
jgi:hypothetical protein